MNRWLLVLIGLCILVSCTSKKEEEGATNQTVTRAFYMGFTPWPYEATLAAQDTLYSFIDSNADLIAHHLDGGVPWPEAATENNFESYGSNVKNEVNGRVSRNSELSNKVVYLAVSPFSSLRNSLALYWNNTTNEALPAPWGTYNLSNTEVITSYTNYMKALIEKLDPTYVNFAVEANEYYHNVPAERVNLDTFITSVYASLKEAYPERTFMISFAMASPESTKMQDTSEFFTSVSDSVDMIGISIYPYAFFSHENKGDPANLPSNWLSQIQTLAPGKPYFIAETGYLGESLSIPSFGLDVVVTEKMQEDFVKSLFQEADELKVHGIVWFSAFDFDRLWESSLGDDLSLVWRDTGLKDGELNDRQALGSWQKWRSYLRQQ